MSEDNRTMAELAREAIQIQNACNLSGLAFGFARAMERFNKLNPHYGTDNRNKHPIFVLWCDKMASLTGCQYSHYLSESYEACEKLAQTGINASPVVAAEER